MSKINTTPALTDLDSESIETVVNRKNINSDFEFSILPEDCQREIIKKISKLNANEEIYLDPVTLNECDANDSRIITVTRVVDEDNRSAYKIRLSDNLVKENFEIFFHSINGEYLPLPKVSLLPPGAIIKSKLNQIQLPESVSQQDPFILLRAPHIELDKSIAGDGLSFYAHTGETLYGSYCAFCYIGEKLRKANEDDFLKLDLSNGTTNIFIFDGIGGSGAGRLACQVVSNQLAYNIRLNLHIEESIILAAVALQREHEEWSQSVLTNLDKTDSMGVCLAGAQISAETAQFHNLGDCQGLLLRKDVNGEYSILYKTPIRTVPYDLLSLGEISYEEFLKREDHHIVTTSVSLIGGEAIQPEIDSSPIIPIKEDDLIILASDGLWDNLTYEEVLLTISQSNNDQELLKNLYHKVKEVVNTLNGKDDNLTILIYRHIIGADQ